MMPMVLLANCLVRDTLFSQFSLQFVSYLDAIMLYYFFYFLAYFTGLVFTGRHKRGAADCLCCVL